MHVEWMQALIRLTLVNLVQLGEDGPTGHCMYKIGRPMHCSDLANPAGLSRPLYIAD